MSRPSDEEIERRKAESQARKKEQQERLQKEQAEKKKQQKKEKREEDDEEEEWVPDPGYYARLRYDPTLSDPNYPKEGDLHHCTLCGKRSS